jgi:hypothetical protein
VDQRNPYAPPQAQVVAVHDTKCTRDGNAVVVQSGNDLPPRCIKCNAPVKGPIKEVKLYWHSPWLYLLVLINILVYLVVGLVVRRTVKVSPGLCEVHSAKRSGRILVFVGLGVGSCAAAIGLLTVGESGLAIAFFVFAVLLLVIGMLVSRKVYAKKITKDYASLGGCKEPFLASLE